MQIDTTRAVTYTGAAVGTSLAFTALRHGGNPKAIAAGLATGAVVGIAQTAVHERTGSGELGWVAAAGSGVVAGALLLGGFMRPGMSHLQARGIGAVIGGTSGIIAPVIAGIVLAQIRS